MAKKTRKPPESWQNITNKPDTAALGKKYSINVRIDR